MHTSTEKGLIEVYYKTPLALISLIGWSHGVVCVEYECED